ncbi:MAG: hypothetical protein AB7P04_01800 [Bacteriovoracia bacterium]
MSKPKLFSALAPLLLATTVTLSGALADGKPTSMPDPNDQVEEIAAHLRALKKAGVRKEEQLILKWDALENSIQSNERVYIGLKQRLDDRHSKRPLPKAERVRIERELGIVWDRIAQLSSLQYAIEVAIYAPIDLTKFDGHPDVDWLDLAQKHQAERPRDLRAEAEGLREAKPEKKCGERKPEKQNAFPQKNHPPAKCG